MNEASREGFVPRHLRDGRFLCRWHLIDMRPGWERDDECPNFPVAGTGVGLCRDHLRRVGAASGMLTRKRAREWLEVDNDITVRQYRAEVDRLQEVVEWQAKRLRGEVGRQARTQPTEGTIYFLRIGGYIKIGWTSDLAKRMRNGYHPDSQLLAVMPGTRADERALHRKHAHLCTAGREWFPMAPQILEEIEAAKREHGEPPAVMFSARPKKAPALGPAPNTRDVEFTQGTA